MMSALIPCSSCGSHVTPSACVCPHCDATLRVCHGNPLARTTAAVLMGLGTMSAGCWWIKPQPDYGVPETGWMDDTGEVDFDGDGWTVSDGDCDDTNADIHPDATETPGDTIDSNCDGADDT
ncbi:MAG: putative metal-binding motif-containing protein [Alphaproteobacteria bacterium]|nr:putative metal-binding motif-containing protein [Alphaproteobacteria bacterium]